MMGPHGMAPNPSWNNENLFAKNEDEKGVSTEILPLGDWTCVACELWSAKIYIQLGRLRRLKEVV